MEKVNAERIADAMLDEAGLQMLAVAVGDDRINGVPRGEWEAELMRQLRGAQQHIQRGQQLARLLGKDKYPSILRAHLNALNDVSGSSEPDGGADVRGEPFAWVHEKAETFVIGGWDKQPFAKGFVPLFKRAPSQPAAPAGHDVIVSLLDDSPCSFDPTPSTSAQGATLTEEQILDVFAKVKGENASGYMIAVGRALLAAHDSGATLTEAVNWRDRCAALIDIYDDGMNNAPEDRCYADGAWREEIDGTRALLAAPTPVADSGASEREVIEPLKEPVSIKKALLGGRNAHVVLSGGTGPVCAAFLVNIQLTGWSDDKSYAEGFAKGFNYAAAWMQDAILAAAKPVSVDAGGMTEVVAELVKCRDMKGSEWFDVKVFDKTLPNGTKLCVATPPTESTGEPK